MVTIDFNTSNIKGISPVTLDIASIEIDGNHLVPLIYTPGISGIYFVRLP